MLVRPNRLMTKSSNNAITSPSMAADFTSGVLDSKITFSRASNATVTGSDGLIEYAPHNLLTYSEQFDNAAWTKSNATITANNTAAPDGTTTADKLVENTANNFHYLSVSYTATASVPYTLSVYAKQDGRSFLSLGFGANPASGGAVFNLATGVITSRQANNTAATITSVGNGWYRCSVTATSTGTNTSVQMFLQTDATTNSYTGNGTSGIYLWGAQLEQRSSAGTYNPTTVKNLLGYSEAFDNAAWTKTNSFVQTNLVTYSQDFDNAAWTKDGVLAFGSGSTANAIVAPNGTQTADLITPTTASAYHRVFSFTGGTATSMTFSAYVKSNGYNKVGLRECASTGAGAAFDLSTGTVIGAYNAGGSTVSNMAVSDQGNGWYRISCTISFASATSMSLGLYVLSPSYVAGANLETTWIANGTSGVYIWGAQLVQGSVAGDYQATYAASAAVQYQAPNGTLTADKLVENTSNAAHYAQQTVTVGTTSHTFSVYAKAAERSFILLEFNSSGGGYAWFNLSTGAVGNTGGGLSAGNCTITSVGNGWHRCAINQTLTTTSVKPTVWVSSANGTTSYTGDGTSGIYIWGAQLSDSASVDTYVNNPVAAPSAAAYYGPRFDYDPVTLQPKGLLIEEQRTNLLLQSETFDNASWTKGSATVTANALTSPDGTVNADKLAEDNALTTHSILQSFNVTSGTSYTMSCYAKAGERNFIQLLMIGGFATNITAIFDLTTGAVGTTNGSPVTQAVSVGNGWWRFSITATANATTTSSAQIRPSSSSSTAFYQGVTGYGIYIWGAQLEAGAFATSYIPTVASQVTRSADVALIQGSNFSGFYNQPEGTLFVSAIPVGTIATNTRFAELSGGTSARVADLYISGAKGTMYNGTTAFTVANPSTVLNTTYNLAGAYKTADYAIAAGGIAPATASSTVVNTATTLYLGRFNDGSNVLNGTIKKLAYYSRRLTNAELQAITS